MKFTDTRGREHSVDIRPSKWKRKEVGEGRGLYQSFVGEILAREFPGDAVLEEFTLPGEGLFLDFFLPLTRLGVEVHGSQHYSYNKYFHRDKSALIEQKKRDSRKSQWCEINNIRLVVIDYDEPENVILSKIKSVG